MSQWLPIVELAEKVQRGELTATELVERSLKTIAEKSEYQAIIVTTEKRAMARAAEIDAQVQKGEPIGRLAGVPFIAKDNFLTFDAETTAASNMLKGFESPYQATAIERLEAEGAICVAKANLDAYAHGSSTENSDFFTTKNPHDSERVPGGSSGGSAAAVVLDMAPFALGTDTGGSIRLPASFTGCIGFKPTYGLVSRSGVVAMASSLDVIGPLTRTVADAATVLDVMAARDKQGYSLTPGKMSELTGKKIGVIREYLSDDVDVEVKACIERAVDKLRSGGADIIEVSLPSLPLALAAYYIICPAEISSNLSRYDAQRYGYSYPDAKNLTESYEKSRGQGLGKEAKRRIIIGTYVLSSGYYDAYYKKAQTVRTKLIEEFDAAFSSVDFLLGPTSPNTAFKIGEHTTNPMHLYLTDIMTVAANLVGVPAISIPAGKAHALPVGLQMVAPQRHDRALLELAHASEGALV
jgi:aspartyl-tRNA(Asn)/glutamyl-tRNA(Gln) amidotransferase subunit A